MPRNPATEAAAQRLTPTERDLIALAVHDLDYILSAPAIIDLIAVIQDDDDSPDAPTVASFCARQALNGVLHAAHDLLALAADAAPLEVLR